HSRQPSPLARVIMGEARRRRMRGERRQDSANSWVRWRAAVAALKQGKVEFAVSELDQLRDSRAAHSEELAGHIDFSLAVALLMANKAEAAIEILQNLLRKAEVGDPHVDPVTTRIELSNAYVQISSWKAALEEADRCIALSS